MNFIDFRKKFFHLISISFMILIIYLLIANFSEIIVNYKTLKISKYNLEYIIDDVYNKTVNEKEEALNAKLKYDYKKTDILELKEIYEKYIRNDEDKDKNFLRSILYGEDTVYVNYKTNETKTKIAEDIEKEKNNIMKEVDIILDKNNVIEQDRKNIKKDIITLFDYQNITIMNKNLKFIILENHGVINTRKLSQSNIKNSIILIVFSFLTIYFINKHYLNILKVFIGEGEQYEK